MTYRQLLMDAAKAAGIVYDPAEPKGKVFFGLWLVIDELNDVPTRRRWNPLTDDGDAARLETSLAMNVTWGQTYVSVAPRDGGAELEYFKHHPNNRAARRWAAVNAAAAMADKRAWAQ